MLKCVEKQMAVVSPRGIHLSSKSTKHTLMWQLIKSRMLRLCLTTFTIASSVKVTFLDSSTARRFRTHRLQPLLVVSEECCAIRELSLNSSCAVMRDLVAIVSLGKTYSAAELPHVADCRRCTGS